MIANSGYPDQMALLWRLICVNTVCFCPIKERLASLAQIPIETKFTVFYVVYLNKCIQSMSIYSKHPMHFDVHL